MKCVGVLALEQERPKKYRWYHVLKRSAPDIIHIPEYDMRLVVAYNNQNAGRIFRKYGIRYAMRSEDWETPVPAGVGLLDGTSLFYSMLPDMVRKLLKNHGIAPEGASVAVVDRSVSVECVMLVEKLCGFCGLVCIATEQLAKAEAVAETMMERYGAVVRVLDAQAVVDAQAAVVLEACTQQYAPGCILIDRSRSVRGRFRNRVIDDFYIPFKVRVPLGISHLSFGECVAKDIDN